MEKTILQEIDEAIEILENQTDEISISSKTILGDVLSTLEKNLSKMSNIGYGNPKVLGEGIELRFVSDPRKSQAGELVVYAVGSLRDILAGKSIKRDRVIGCFRAIRSVLKDESAIKGTPDNDPKQAEAIAVLMVHPTWSNEQIAKKIGIHKNTLSRKSYTQFKAARQSLKDKSLLAKGEKFNGNIEAFSDPDDEN